MLKKILFTVFILFFFSDNTIGQTSTTSGTAYIWSTPGSWNPSGVPAAVNTVTVNHPLTLDQNLTISTGNYTFNQDVTDQPGGINYNLTNLDAAGSLIIASGTTTIGGVTSIGGNAVFTLTVKSGAVLVLGTMGSTSNNFLIGNKVNITIESGGSIIVYGNVVNSNSSGTFNVNGLLQVYGNYVTNNGNININGTGEFYTSGSMSTQGSGDIYGSGNDCTSNCSGTSLGCGTGGTAYTATISPQNQTVCSGGAVLPLTFSTNAPSPTYLWQYSLSAGGTYTDISGATSNTYTPSPLTVTTWYRVKYTSSAAGCGTKYSAPVPVYVSASTYTQSTGGQTVCAGTFGPISVSAFGTGLTYQWYSNNSASNSGGTLVSGAISNVYTPSSAVGGTKYYYCVINSSCGIPFTTAVSGAFTVNLNTVGTASSSPSLCANTLMTNVTHAATGTTGIANDNVSGANGLPSGVSAHWASNTITISGTPTASGIFNYSIPLTGGCGNVNAVGTITVNSLSASPTGITGTTVICNGSSTTLTVNGGTAGTGAVAEWFTGSCGGIAAGTGSSITVSPTSNTTYYVRYNGACNTTACASAAVTVNDAPTITPITAPAAICAGVSLNPVVSTVFSNGSSITASGWQLETGAGSGMFANLTGPYVAAAADNNKYIRYYATNNCGTAYSNQVVVTVDSPVGVPVFALGTSSSRCQGAGTVTYTATAANTTGITYTLDAASVTGGNSIDTSTGQVTYAAGWSGTSIITASAAGCGGPATANHTVTITGTVGTPGSITGNFNQCAGNTLQVYSISPVVNAVSYNWFLPSDWTITNGTGTNSITVTVGTMSGSINVNAVNSCGTGFGPYIGVIASAPTIAGTLSPANTNVCSGSNFTNLVLASYTGSIIRWESSADNFATAGIPIANTNNNYGASNLTADTYYRVVIQSGGCNVLYSNSVKITVYGAMTAPSGISVDGGTPYPSTGAGISHCALTSTVFSIAPIANASSYTWVIPTGWTLVSGQGTTTLTVITGDTSQSANIEVYASNTGCGNTNSSYLYLYLNPSTAPQVTLTQPSCFAASGTVTVIAPAPAPGITYTLTGTNPVTAPVTNATGVFAGLSAGVYNLTVNNGAYVSAIPKVITPSTACVSTASITINALVTKTWNGSWSPAGAPASNDFVVINANYNTSSNGDLNACSLTVNTGYVLTITSGTYVVVQNNLTVNGTLDILDKGSLVMVNDLGTVTNNGVTKVRRITTPFKKNDYIYWSTPVNSSAISSAVFPGWRTNYAYEYTNAWVNAYTMTPAKGYIIMVPDPTTAPGGNISEVIFNGKVNNGVQKITGVVPDKAYLIGNPYPSALDAEAFLDYNAGVITGTLYFWTHNTAIQLASNITNGSAGSGAYAYTSDDYASYNAVGGVGVGSGSAAVSGGMIPSGKIGSGQGFFASSNIVITGTNEIVFNNSMRLGSGGTTLDNSQFFKTKKPAAKTARINEKHRIWLNFFNDKGAFKQTLIGYVTGATNSNDARFDGDSMNGNKYIDFYSVNQNRNLVIQGRALPFEDKDEVPLGYKTTVKGMFTIKIEQADGLLSNQTVFLEDKLTHTEFDLRSGNYSFNTEAGTFNNRFVLKYKSAKTLGTDNFDTQKNQVLVSVKSKLIKINSFAETIEKVQIYDVSGKQIYKNDHVNNNELSITNFIAADQVLIVKTILQNGAVTTDKIVF